MLFKIRKTKSNGIFSLIFSSNIITKMSPNYRSVTRFRDLDETALLKVMEYLSLEELCAVKGVCRHLRKIAIRTFNRRYAGAVHFDDLMFNMPEIMCTIKCFGSCIESATINGSVAWELNTSILEMLMQNCGRLKKLRLICFHFDKPEIAIMKTLVQQLEIIEFLYCTMDIKFGINYNIFLKAADKMKELVFIGQDQEIDLKCLNKKFLAMEKLEIISVRLIDEEVLGYFLRKNRAIKHFSYMPNTPMTTGRAWTHSFDYFAPYLSEISIELNKNIDYIHLFSSLIKLQRVVISCQGYNKPIYGIITQLAKMNTIKVLGLWHIPFGEFLTLPKLNNIETLELRKIKSLIDLSDMTNELNKRWKNVENLYLDYTAIREANDVEMLVENNNQLSNLFLCDIRGFFIMPNAIQYDRWCSKRCNPLNIFIDSRYLMQHTFSNQSQAIVFQPFRSRINQMLNVICGANL